jgi:hypothetical protein
MKANRTLIAAAVAALIPLGAAIAADNDQYGDKDKSGMPDSSFKKLDTNKDGRISQAEAAADTTVVFSTADANGDGYLDSAEWKASAKGSSNKPQSDMPSSPHQEQVIKPEGTTATPSPDTETPRQ